MDHNLGPGVGTRTDVRYPERFLKFIDEVNRAGGAYHQMDFGQGVVLNGEYEMSRYLPYYGLPEDLKDKSVLDIGTASGFFAIECARRGGNVTAIDVGDGRLVEGICDGLGLDVMYARKSIFDLDESWGSFDLVICGSLLLHLCDIFGAVRRIRSVCKGEAIVATGMIPRSVDATPKRSRWRELFSLTSQINQRIVDPRVESLPLLQFVGIRTVLSDSEYWTYWLTNMTALKKMMIDAGFSRAEEVSRFTLYSVPASVNHYATPHGVVRAYV